MYTSHNISMVDLYLHCLSACILQMILKFFDIFLKMKDISSSEAFMVMSLYFTFYS